MTQTIGSRIMSLRENRGLTRSDVAKAVGVTFAAVFQWEENNREPRRQALNKLAEVLGVSVPLLLTGKESSHGKTSAAPKKKVGDLLKQAQADFAAAMDLPPERVRVTVEEIIGPVGGKVGRRHRSG